MNTFHTDRVGIPRRSMVSRWLAVTCLVSVLQGAIALADQPSVKLQSGTLVSASNWWSHYSSATTHTTGLAAQPTTAPEIVELANALSAGGAYSGSQYANAVYEYVTNNIAIEFRFGLSKGALGAIVDQSGTAFDQAALMIALLRQGGVTASYQGGTIALTAAQFQAWTQMRDPTTGGVTAAAACQFLADGGIPATVNGASSCSGLTGDLVSSGTAVSMAHVWVVVGGTVYDPAYKIHLNKPGIGIAALGTAAGCGSSCLSQVLSYIPSPVSTSVSGVTSITSVQQGPLEGQLASYAVNLQKYIQQQNTTNYGTAPNMLVEDLLGGRVIDITQTTTTGSLLPAAAYSPASSLAWTGDLPDQYRTTLTVQYGTAGALVINQLLYADETAGQRLRIFLGTGSSGVNPSGGPFHANLYAERMLLATGSITDSPATALVPLTLVVTHPYANPSGGTYLSESLAYNTMSIFGAETNTLTIVQQFGDASESTINYYNALVQRDTTHTPPPTTSPQNPSLSGAVQLWMGAHAGGGKFWCANPTTGAPTAPAPYPTCDEVHQGMLAASWAAQVSRVAQLTAGVNGSLTQLHHSLGVISSGPQIGNDTLYIDIQSSMSVDSQSATAADREAAFVSTAAAMNRLEGSIIEQQGDVILGGAAVSLFGVANGNNMAFYDVPATANMSKVLSKLLTNYGSYGTSDMTAYNGAGYEMIIPQNGSAGTYCGTYSGSGCTFTAFFNGVAAYDAAGDRIAYLTASTGVGWDKGSSGPSDPLDIVTQQTTIKNYSTKGKEHYAVNLSSGGLELMPAPDLVTGDGAFPYSLSYQRYYAPESEGLSRASLSAYATRSGSELSGLPIGWTHSLAITARLTNDGLASLGRNSALDASGAIAGLYVARVLNAGASTFQSKLATVFVANWLGKNLFGNVVSVTRPPQHSAFVLLPDGITYNPEPGNAELLTQSGQRVPGVIQQSPFSPLTGGLGWINDQLTFTLREKDGSALTFAPAAGTYYPQGTLYSAQQWAFPSGVTLTFTYDLPGSTSNNVGLTGDFAGCLTSVSNNLGRSLTFNDYCETSITDPQADLGAQTVQDDSGRTVNISTTPASGDVLYGERNPNNCGCMVSEITTADQVAVGSLLVKGADGSSTSEYNYAAAPTTNINRTYYRISAWLTPIEYAGSTTPYVTAAFDSLYRVKTLTDPLGFSTSYSLTGLFGTENQKSSNVVDPLRAFTTEYRDRWNSLLQSIDPDSRVTSYTYDSARRLIQKTLPELNGFTYAYDVRSNLLSTTRHPVPGSALALAGTTTATSTTYQEGPTAWPCVSPNTCNKPFQETDANVNVTTYQWNSNGTLANITYPNVVDAGTTVGTPYTAYTYASYGLLATKTERVSQNPSVVNLVTQYNYNTSLSTFPLISMVVDYGGENVTTSYVFDGGGTGPGNVTQITDPNGNATGYRYDQLRRLTEIDAPLSATKLYTYDLDGQLTSTQRYDSTRSAYQIEVKYYWPTGDLAYVVHPDANPTAPAQGTPTTVTSLPCPSSYVTCYSYDADNRLLAMSEPLNASSNRVSANAYDPAGQRLCSWHGFGTTASALAQVTGSTPCNWTPSSYSPTAALRYDFLAYSANGKVTNSTDSDGNLTALNYDGFDRLSQMLLPGSTLGTSAPCHPTYTAGDDCEQYGYDNNDNRKAKTNRDGSTLTFSFDAMNWEYQRLIPANPNGHFSRTLTETHDLLGRKYQATADSQTLTFNYDTAGRLSSVVDSILGSVQYAHDPADNRTQITWPDGYSATYAYDALNRVCKVKESATTTCAASDPISSLVSQYVWDTLSRAQSLSFGNGVTTGWSYFNDSALGGITHTIGTKSVGFAYTRNQVNQLATQTVSITDPTGALKAESFILQPSSASSTAYVPNNLNQYGSVAGVTNAFDLNGNLTSDGTYTFEYDEENRLRSATGAGNTVTYDYDPLGRRRAKTVNGTMTRFLSDDQEEIGEYNSTPALLRRYLNGSSVDEHLVQIEAAGAHYYVQTNHQGTTLLTSDTSSPPVLTAFNYGAYGESSSPTTGAAFRYAGRRLDPETGLYYYRARYYSPTLGRFLQTDPIGSKYDPNLYTYAGNDPLDGTDPTGQFKCVPATGSGPKMVICTANGEEDAIRMFAYAASQGWAIAPGTLSVQSGESSEKAPSSSSDDKKDTEKESEAGETQKIPNDRLKAPPKKRGDAPIGEDDKPVELHHKGQKPDSPLEELTREDHRGGDNFKKNHENTGERPSEIDRGQWKRERRDYWNREWDSGRFEDVPKDPNDK